MPDDSVSHGPCEICEVTCNTLGKEDPAKQVECKDLFDKIGKGTISDADFQGRMEALFGWNWSGQVLDELSRQGKTIPGVE